MDVTIRKATIEDLPKIQELSLKMFKKEHKEFDSLLDLEWTHGEIGEEYFTTKIVEDTGFTILAVYTGEIVGYLCGCIGDGESFRNAGIVANLNNIFVEENLRSQGVGEKLIEQFIVWCKEKNVSRIQVKVTARNLRGIDFYKRNSFKEYDVTLEREI